MTLSPAEQTAHQLKARDHAELIAQQMGAVLAAGNHTDDDLARFVRDATKGVKPSQHNRKIN